MRGAHHFQEGAGDGLIEVGHQVAAGEDDDSFGQLDEGVHAEGNPLELALRVVGQPREREVALDALREEARGNKEAAADE